MTPYQKYIKGLVEVEDLSQKDFNALMIEWYADYKSRNGQLSFKEFMKHQEDYMF